MFFCNALKSLTGLHLLSTQIGEGEGCPRIGLPTVYRNSCCAHTVCSLYTHVAGDEAFVPRWKRKHCSTCSTRL